MKNVNGKTKLALLAGVMTVTSFYETGSLARGLVPDRPSVEIRLEALRSLRHSVDQEQYQHMEQVLQAPATGSYIPPAPVAQQPTQPVPQVQPYQPKPSLYAQPQTINPAVVPPQRPKAPVPTQQALKPAPVVKEPVIQEYTPPKPVAPAPQPAPVIAELPTQEPKPSAPVLKPVQPPASVKAESPALPVSKPQTEPKEEKQETVTASVKEKKADPAPIKKEADEAFIPQPEQKPTENKIVQNPDTNDSKKEKLPELSLPENNILPEELPPEDAMPVQEADQNVESLLDLSLEDITSEPSTEKALSVEQKAIEKPQDAPFAKLESLETLPELPPTDEPAANNTAQEEMDSSLADLSLPEEPLEALPELPANDKTTSVEKSGSLEILPEPDLEDLQFEEFKEPADDVPEKEGTEEQENNLEVTAEAAPVSPVETIEIFQKDGQPTDEVASLPDEEATAVVEPEPPVDSDNGKSDSKKSDQLPEIQDINIADEETPPAAPALAEKAPAEKKSDGLFPNLSKAFSSLFGDDDKKSTAVNNIPAAAEPSENTEEETMMDGQPSDMAMPEIMEKSQEEAPDITAIPQTDDITETAQAVQEELPELPEFDSTEESVPMDSGLPPLPDFNDNAAPALSAEAENLESLPPLPFGNEESAPAQNIEDAPQADDKGSQQMASLQTTEKNMELPDINDMDFVPDDKNVKLSVRFSKSETEVPLAFQQPLIALSKELIANPDKNIKVVAYASGTDDQKSIAKRISLARALAVRAFLIDLGVDNVRISVQALGNDESGRAPERADVLLN